MKNKGNSYYEKTIYNTGKGKWQAENRLEERVWDLLGVSQTAGIIGGIYDKELTIGFISQSVLRMMGYSYQEFMEQTKGKAGGFIYAPDMAAFKKTVEEWSEEKEREYRVVNIDGRPIWCREVRFDYEEEGEKRWMISIRSVDELFKKEWLNRQMLMSLTHIYCEIYILDLMQDHYEQIYPVRDTKTEGCFSKDFEVIFPDEMIHPGDMENVRSFFSVDYITQALGDREKIEFRYRRRKPGAGYEWWNTCFTVGQRRDNQVISVTMASRSIQDVVTAEEKNKSFLLEAMEEAKAANEAKNAFLSRMSHDLRTPINGILGMTSLAQMNLNSPDKVAECLDKVQISGNYLLMLVNELLDFSKLESSQMALEEKPFDLMEAVGDCLEMVRPQQQEREQTLQLTHQGLEHTKVEGDRLRLQQLITNIVGNSIKYTPHRGIIQVDIRELKSKQPNLGHFSIEIRDNGIGMPPEFLEHIFEPFTRVEDAYTSKVGGTGLGMAIAHNIATKMGGNIEVTSQQGEGSTFVVNLYLKLQENPQEEAPKEQMDGRVQERDYTGFRILLAEDNDINRELAQNVLEMTGVQVDTAVDGKEAAEKFAKSPTGYYDMIFMDVRMPVMDGYQATRMIRSLQRGDSQLPVVALTANAFADDVVSSMKAGMNEHIAKPLKISRIYATLDKWLKQEATI